MPEVTSYHSSPRCRLFCLEIQAIYCLNFIGHVVTFNKVKARANSFNICFNIRSILLNSDVETVCPSFPFNRVKTC